MEPLVIVSRRSDHDDDFAAVDRQVDVLQRVKLAVVLLHVIDDY
jgi:hypothetical protein